MGIINGIRGMRTCDVPVPEPRGKGYKKKRDVDAFKDPQDLKTVRALKVHLCDQLHSDCAHCEIMCGYGRRYLELTGQKAVAI